MERRGLLPTPPRPRLPGRLQPSCPALPSRVAVARRRQGPLGDPLHDGPLEALRGPRSLLQPEPLLPRLGVPGQGRPRRGPLLLLPGVPLSMRPELLPFLACPGCGAALELRPFRGSGFAADEVEEGLLHCRSCGLAYPVTGS